MANVTKTLTMTVSWSGQDLGSDGSDTKDQNPFIFAGGLILLFILLAGMAASVDTQAFKGHFKRPKPILVGLFCQFVCLPLFGYLSVLWFDVSQVVSIALLTTCMSPGGAFSNWFCSLFNADLALSIAMTTTSTLLALVVLPLNMYIYVSSAYGSSVVLDWASLFISVGSAAAGMITGVWIGWKHPEWRRKCNIAASFAGIALVLYGAFTSTTVALPCLMGVAASTLLCYAARLEGPTSVAIAIECGYQNTGIAMSIVLATFKGDDQGEALGVPLYYGTIQAIVLIIYNLCMWKMGRTYAPIDVTVPKMITTNYQPVGDEPNEPFKKEGEEEEGEEEDVLSSGSPLADEAAGINEAPRQESNPMVRCLLSGEEKNNLPKVHSASDERL